ncbi:MAG TPA: cyclase family protein, partial [Methanomicrobiales archaeon]|nr:cyclase family protein [Methanomicrobiales archaeon]
MRLYDATRLLSNTTPTFPGDPEIHLDMHEEGTHRVSDLHLGTHSGTHVDAPLHYLKNGTPVDRIPFSALMGACRLIEFPDVEGGIDRKDLENQIEGTEKILLKTWYSGEDSFIPEYPYLTEDAASLLVRKGINCVGIDTPSIEVMGGDGSVHRTFLSEGIAVIEMLDLSGIPPGDYWMVALPLRLEGLDGSPARVVLWSDYRGEEG